MEGDDRRRLRGINNQFNVSFQWDSSGSEAWAAFDKIEETANLINEKARALSVPGGDKLQGFQILWQGSRSGSKWASLKTDLVMRWTAMFGCVVSCIFVFVILCLTTTNIILAALSTFVIGCIIVCCIGFVTLAFEASFGFMEAICITICVGFSIDFVAHLAIAYKEADRNLSRYERTRKALTDLGVSIVGACLTTFGAAIFMTPNGLIPM